MYLASLRVLSVPDMQKDILNISHTPAHASAECLNIFECRHRQAHVVDINCWRYDSKQILELCVCKNASTRTRWLCVRVCVCECACVRLYGGAALCCVAFCIGFINLPRCGMQPNNAAYYLRVLQRDGKQPQITDTHIFTKHFLYGLFSTCNAYSVVRVHHAPYTIHYTLDGTCTLRPSADIKYLQYGIKAMFYAMHNRKFPMKSYARQLQVRLCVRTYVYSRHKSITYNYLWPRICSKCHAVML